MEDGKMRAEKLTKTTRRAAVAQLRVEIARLIEADVDHRLEGFAFVAVVRRVAGGRDVKTGGVIFRGEAWHPMAERMGEWLGEAGQVLADGPGGRGDA